MGALGQAGVGAVGCDSSIGDGGVAQCSNRFLLDDHFAADVTMGALGQAGVGAVGGNRGIGDGGVAQCRNDFGLFIGTDRAGQLLLTGSIAVGLGDRFFADLMAGAPESIGIGIGTGGGSCGVAVIAVLQLGSSQRNLGIAGILNQLVGHGVGTGGTHNHLAIAGGDDVGAAGSGIDIAGGCIDSAVDNNLGILQVLIRTGILLSGSIGHGHQLLVGRAAEVAPLIHIIDKDLFAGAQLADSACLDLKFHTGQNSQILADGDIAAALDPDGHIAVEGQIVVSGVNVCAGNPQAHRGHAHIALQFYDQTVGGTIIALGHRALRHGEHGATGANKGHGETLLTKKGNRNTGIALFGGARHQGQRCLYILHIILAEGENPVIHIQRLGAATEVRELEALIDRGTTLGGNGTGAGNEAPGIQRTTIGNSDGAVRIQVHKAGRTGRGTGRFAGLTGNNSGGNTHFALHRQVGARCQRHGPVSGGLCIGGSGSSRCIRIKGIQYIKGNQQGNTAGNRIITRGQGGIVHQNNGLVCRGLCGLHRCSQALVKMGIVHKEPGRCGSKNCPDSHVCRRRQVEGCVCGNELSICIGPANKGNAGSSRCLQRCALRCCDFLHITSVYCSAVCSHRTKSGVKIISDIIGCIGVCHHKIAEVQLIYCSIFCRGHHNINFATGWQRSVIGAVGFISCGTSDLQIIDTLACPPERKNYILAGRIIDGNGCGLGLGAKSKDASAALGGNGDNTIAHGVVGSAGNANLNTLHRSVGTACCSKECRSHAQFNGLIETDDGLRACIAGFQLCDFILAQRGNGRLKGIHFCHSSFHVSPHHVDHDVDDLVLGQDGCTQILGQDGIHLSGKVSLYLRLSFLSLSGLGFFGCRSFGIAVAADGAGILNTALHLSGLIAVTGGIGFIGSVAVATCAGKGGIALVGASRCSHGFGIAVLVSGLRCLCLFGDGCDGFFRVFMVVGLGFRGEGLGRHHGKKHDHCHHKRQKPPGVICKHCIPS